PSARACSESSSLSLHDALPIFASTLRLVGLEGWTATWTLIGISLLYGVFHAAGPGHGKAVITTYLGTSRTRLRRGLFLSISSARSEEHSLNSSHVKISYAVFCL